MGFLIVIQLSEFHFHFTFGGLRRNEGTHPVLLAWKSPARTEPTGLRRVPRSRTRLKRTLSSSNMGRHSQVLFLNQKQSFFPHCVSLRLRGATFHEVCTALCPASCSNEASQHLIPFLPSFCPALLSWEGLLWVNMYSLHELESIRGWKLLPLNPLMHQP